MRGVKRRAYFQETWRPYLQSPPMLTTLQASTASSPGLTAELVGSSAHLWLLHTKLGITNVTKIPRNAISLPGTLVLSTKYCHCFFTSVPTNVTRRRTRRNKGTCVRRAAVVGQLEREGAQRYDRLLLSRSRGAHSPPEEPQKGVSGAGSDQCSSKFSDKNGRNC